MLPLLPILMAAVQLHLIYLLAPMLSLALLLLLPCRVVSGILLFMYTKNSHSLY